MSQIDAKSLRFLFQETSSIISRIMEENVSIHISIIVIRVISKSQAYAIMCHYILSDLSELSQDSSRMRYSLCRIGYAV